MTGVSIEAACAALSARTNVTIDNNDLDGFAALFTDDCVLVRDGHRIEGRETLRALLGQRDADRVTRHVQSQILVERTAPGEAKGVSSFILYEAHRSQGDAPYPLGAPAAVGEFRDVFRLTDAGWRIAERVILVLFTRQEPSQ